MSLEHLIQWRRDLHRLPEAAWKEFRTTSLIAHHLSGLGYHIVLGDKLLASNLVMGRDLDVAAEKARARRQGAHPDWLDRIGDFTGLMGNWTPAVPARRSPFALTSTRWRWKSPATSSTNRSGKGLPPTTRGGCTPAPTMATPPSAWGWPAG